MNNVTYTVSDPSGKVLCTCVSLIEAFAVAHARRLEPENAITITQGDNALLTMKLPTLDALFSDLVRNRATRYCVTESFCNPDVKKESSPSNAFVLLESASQTAVVNFLLSMASELETLIYIFDRATGRGYYQCLTAWSEEGWSTYTLKELD